MENDGTRQEKSLSFSYLLSFNNSSDLFPLEKKEGFLRVLKRVKI